MGKAVLFYHATDNPKAPPTPPLMLNIHHSNRMERLAEALAEALLRPQSAPFEPETIIIQSNGMRRWVSIELAQRLGIAANLRFPYPAAFIWQACQAVLPQTPEDSPFAAIESLAWRVLGLFDGLADDATFAPLQDYLSHADPLERYQLAWTIAVTLDQYLVYRPDWITRWEAGEDAHWQAALWRQLAAGDFPHRAKRHQAFLNRLKTLTQPPPELPARLFCIGIPSLPAAYLDALQQLARLIDVHLYLLNPCRQYWSLIRAEREIARQIGDNAEADALYLETGNRLLASLGRQGRDFHHLIADLDAASEDRFEDVAEDSLLHSLQADILDLHNRGRNHDVCPEDVWTEAVPATPLAAGDHSVQIHVCHSPMREVEALYDRLLDLFQQDPDLKASDIVVMTPDIETYAPAIRAVFGTAEQAIPFSVADRPWRMQNPAADAFLNLLERPGGRFAVNQVTALLEAPPVQRRFGLTEADLGLINRWLRETAIRWGVDEHNRAALELPPTVEHTWQAGLRRLLLGFALPAGEQRLYREILPFDAMEGEQARIMGKLQHFAHQLFSLNTRLAGEKTIPEWQEALRELLADFIAVDDAQESEWELVCAALDELGRSAAQAEFIGTVPLAVVRAWLTRKLDSDPGVEGFLGSGVTFCAMLPMRSIPFRVVCLIGLNHDSYPRPQRPPDFDLMAQHPRRGDRSRPLEDRYLFLEALLSARDVLYLSYVGSSIRDNSVIPPSVLVSELLDYIRQGFHPPGQPDGAPLPLLVTRHPLQAFSPRYFDAAAGKPVLFSYSQTLGAAAQALGRGERESEPLFQRELPELEDEYRHLEVQHLISFFRHPVRHLLQTRLQVRLQEGEELLETREPFMLERFTDRAIRQQLFDLQSAGQTPAQILPIIRARGLLPHGQIGQALYGQEVGKVKKLLKTREQITGEEGRKLPVDLTLNGFQLTGWLDNVTAAGLVEIDVNPLGAKEYLTLWIRHLLLNHLQPEGVKQVSVCQGLNERLMFEPVAEAETILQDLLALYEQGLRRPLKFFPKTSLAFMKTGEKKDPMVTARKTWEGNSNPWGESQDVYYALAFRGGSPIDEEFADLARRVFGPLLDHREE